MEQRNKFWRRQHTARLFKRRMMLFAACGTRIFDDESGTWNKHPHWFEIAKQHWAHAYKSDRKPCSCFLCKGERYNRTDNKKKTGRIIREAEN